jgi:hypothetical protein
MSRALATVAALAALMLPAPAALADCPPGTVVVTIGQSVFCQKCPPALTPNSSNTACVCPPNTIDTSSGNHSIHPHCSSCPPNQVPDKTQKKCVACPVGPEARFGRCVPTLTPSHPVALPGFLESTPGLGSESPAGVGTPRGGARAK